MTGFRGMIRTVSAALMVAGILFLFFGGPVSARAEDGKTPEKLLIVWTSADREVARNMVFMYAFNGKKNNWWKEIRLLVWGPSQKLLVQDTELQEYVKKMKDAGVELLACKACADGYGVSADLQKLGVEVKYTGTTLTEMLKTGWTTITF